MNNELREKLAKLVDTCDNYLELSKNTFMRPDMKADALKTGLQDVRNQIALLIELDEQDQPSGKPGWMGDYGNTPYGPSDI